MSAPVAAFQPHRSLANAGATHPAVRRYSLARRNLLPRDEPVVAVHGRWAHHHLVESEARIDCLLWCPAAPDEEPDLLVSTVAGQASAAYRISARTLARIHPTAVPGDMVSLVRLPQWSLRSLLRPETRGLLLVADGIEYGGNLGTLIRSVDASGADGLLLTSPVVRRTHPKVFTASRGMVVTTPVAETSVDAARQALAAAGFAVLVADPSATRDYLDHPYPASGRVAIVVGSEGEGVAAGWRRPELGRLAIPMHGRADSLNVAVSASILLFDARRRLR